MVSIYLCFLCFLNINNAFCEYQYIEYSAIMNYQVEFVTGKILTYLLYNGYNNTGRQNKRKYEVNVNCNSADTNCGKHK